MSATRVSRNPRRSNTREAASSRAALRACPLPVSGPVSRRSCWPLLGAAAPKERGATTTAPPSLPPVVRAYADVARIDGDGNDPPTSWTLGATPDDSHRVRAPPCDPRHACADAGDATVPDMKSDTRVTKLLGVDVPILSAP